MARRRRAGKPDVQKTKWPEIQKAGQKAGQKADQKVDQKAGPKAGQKSRRPKG